MNLLKHALTVCLVVNSGWTYDYDYTPLEDPLGPIWSRLESLSQDVLRGFQSQMSKFQTEAESYIDTKFHNLASEMNKTSGGLVGTGSSSKQDPNWLTSQVKNAVTGWIENFYHETIRKDTEAAVAKAEGNIKVRINALENKLIEHINIKISTLAGGAGSNSSSGGSGGASLVLPAGTPIGDIETNITNHITSKLSLMETSLSRQLGDLGHTLMTSQTLLSGIDTHVSKISQEIVDERLAVEGPSASTSSESCSSLVDRIGSLVNNTQLSTDFLNQQESRWREMQSVIADMKDTPSFLPRDCSDIHWLHHEAVSGVYQIYPSLDRKSSISAWCDMVKEGGAKSDGGWTVILRRRETDFGHVDFNRTWKEYASGFGDPAEGEWWFSLRALHSLTYRQPYTVRFVLKDIEEGTFYADYDSFRVEDESHKFRLIVDGFSGNVTKDAFMSKHHGRPFSTPDEDNDNYEGGSCAISNSGGWWFNACYYSALTAPFPTSKDREAKTIRWVGEEHWLVLDDVTVKIRPSDYAKRFDSHEYETS